MLLIIYCSWEIHTSGMFQGARPADLGKVPRHEFSGVRKLHTLRLDVSAHYISKAGIPYITFGIVLLLGLCYFFFCLKITLQTYICDPPHKNVDFC